MLKPFIAAPADRWLKARLATTSGRWRLLLSHPDDFAERGFEADRWMLLIAAALSRTELCVVALHQEQHARTWISQLEERSACASDKALHRGVIDLRLRALERAIADAARTRCVVIVDDQLRVHRTIAYARRDQAPSLLDVIAHVDRIRLEKTASSCLQVTDVHSRRRTA